MSVLRDVRSFVEFNTADSDLLVHHCFAVFLNEIDRINSKNPKNSISLPILIEI